MEEVSGTPQKGTVLSSPIERAVGRICRVPIELLGGLPKEAVYDLAGDVFQHCYALDPALKEEGDVEPERAVNRAIMEYAFSQENHVSARTTTCGNSFKSAIFASLLTASLQRDDVIKKALKQQEQAAQAQQEAEQKQQEAEQKRQESQQKRKQAQEEYEQAEKAKSTGEKEALQSQADEHDNQADKAEQEAEQAQQRSEQAQALAHDLEERAVETIEKQAESVEGRGRIINAVKEAKEGAKEAEAFTRGWGRSNEAGTPTDINPQEVMGLMQQNQAFVKRIAELAGRFAEAAARTREKVVKSRISTIAEVDVTKDLTRVFPSELRGLSPHAIRVMQIQTVAKYASNGLLGWKPVADAKRSGAIHIVIDESGSMNGQPILIAKAIAMGLVTELRNEEHRRWAVSKFGDRYDGFRTIDDQSSFKEVMTWTREFLDANGTDFDFAIQSASEAILKRYANEGEVGIDLVFITDGLANLQEKKLTLQALEAIEAIGVRLMLIVIGYESDYLTDLPNLAKLKVYVPDDDFRKPDFAEKIVEQLTEAALEPWDKNG